MKRFLKKANRGLLLGAFALIVLIIYIVVDYSSFSSEKPKIKEAVENYIGDFYATMEANDYDALEAHIRDTWSAEPVVSQNYYEKKDEILTLFDNLEAEEDRDEYGEITYSINKLTVKKSGPDMAQVSLKFSANVEYGCSGDIIEPFSPYTSYWYNSEEKDERRYIYEMDFEGVIFLRKEDDQWKISQSSVYSNDCIQHLKEEE